MGFHIQEGAVPELIHLGWHHKLMNNSPDEYVARLGPFKAFECSNFLDEQLEDIVSFIKTVWRKNQNRVPYGIGSDNFALFFDGEGDVANRSPGSGLTCATFLMSIFASQLYPVIDESSWATRESDKDWQGHVLDTLLATVPNIGEHVAEQRKQVGVAFRYRPEEVASSAAIYDDEPIVFDEAVKNGAELVEALKASGVLV